MLLAILAIHQFNPAGYPLLFDYFIQRPDEQLTHQLNAHQYNDNDLIEVKMALHTPYLSNWSDHEPIDGETHQPVISESQSIITGPYQPPRV